MKVTPKTEKQLKEELNRPDGEYPFTVTFAKDEVSRAGNEMIHIKLRLFAPDGNQFMIDDYLMDSMGFKLRHFCEETGLLEKYESGNLKAYDCENKEGIAQVYTQKSKDPKYADKNAIKDYGEKEKKPAKEKVPAPVEQPKEEGEDVVPF